MSIPGVERLGVPLDEHIQLVIDALTPHAEALGIAGAERRDRRAPPAKGLDECRCTGSGVVPAGIPWPFWINVRMDANPDGEIGVGSEENFRRNESFIP